MIGIDEVGRGCLAGPLLVVAARAVSELPDDLRDSKVLSRVKREELLDLLSISCKFGEGWVEATEIDASGLAAALRLGLRRALEAIGAAYEDEIIYDGPINYAPQSYKNVKCLIKADELIPIVSAASIYAKVKRDQFMFELMHKYPGYGFECHVGYATQRHREAIAKLGPIELVHRMSFSPLRQIGMEL